MLMTKAKHIPKFWEKFGLWYNLSVDRRKKYPLIERINKTILRWAKLNI
jgi:hypothetical protein